MATPKKDEKEKVAPIIVKKIIKKGGGHHGGAWKVAYADFVTAMMAFFLLLWLLNVTTKVQKNAISDYFDPSHPKVSDVVSGAGGILGGMTVAPEGAMVSTVQPLIQTKERVTSTHGELQGTKNPHGQESDEQLSEEQLAKELQEKEDKRFQQAAEQLKAEIAKSPELKDLQNNILIDITPEGLRIQIVDDKGRSMFPSGSAVMYDFMRAILLKISGVIVPLPNQVSVRGHTDSNKYKDPKAYDNWNLSADRAQASRRVLVTGGLPEMRVENVMGRADREPLEKDPAAARNRRISIILMRHQPTKEELAKQKAEDAKAAAEKKASEGQKTAPLTILDDTIQGPDLPEGVTPKTSTSKTSGKTAAPAEANQPQLNTPLPITPQPETFKPQPQVMYFGDTKHTDDNAPLYDGPTVAPIQKGPPRIKTPVFELGDDEASKTVAPSPKSAEPESAPQAVIVTPAAPAVQATPADKDKAVTFGDAVPPQDAPLKRALLPTGPNVATPAPADGPKVLDIDGAPTNSGTSSAVPPQTDLPTTPSAPEATDGKNKQLSF